jgi:hypothetical protein
VSGWILRRLKLCRIGLALRLSKDSLRGFLGLTSYYHKFDKNYGKIVVPLTALLKNNSFAWTPKTDHSFKALKEAMCTTPVLALPDFIKTFFLECDSSRRGIGAFIKTNKQLS